MHFLPCLSPQTPYRFHPPFQVPGYYQDEEGTRPVHLYLDQHVIGQCKNIDVSVQLMHPGNCVVLQYPAWPCLGEGVKGQDTDINRLI